MKDFVLLFRTDLSKMPARPSAEEIKMVDQMWAKWLGDLGAQGKIANIGNRINTEGRVVKSNTVENGPYAKNQETVVGYIIVRAEGFDEAVVLAKGCPIIQAGGNVEVRKAVPPDDRS
jgi:hypothetical protein